MHWEKHLTYIVGAINISILQIRVGTDKLSDLIEVTQLVYGRAEI